MTKNPEVILARIEEQRKQLGLSRADVALQTGMKYQTYASLFRRGKLPKFNELRNICNSLGLSIDDLIGDNPPDQKSKTNIFYWINKHNGGELSPTSILSRLPDKEGVARMFMDLSAAQNEHVRFSDEVFTLICKLLFMDETDFLFVYINHIRPRLRRIDLTDKGYFHSLKVYTSLSEIYSFEYNRFFLREAPIRRFKPADAYLWDKIYKTVEGEGVDKQDFFAKAGISPALYSIYKPFDEFAWKKKNEEIFNMINRKNAWEYPQEEWDRLMLIQRKHEEKHNKQFSSKRPSPYTETIINIFEYLGITGIEDCIRAGYKTTLGIEDYHPSESINTVYYTQDSNPDIVLADSLYARAIQENLCFMPHLAEFLSALCAFSNADSQDKAPIPGTEKSPYMILSGLCAFDYTYFHVEKPEAGDDQPEAGDDQSEAGDNQSEADDDQSEPGNDKSELDKIKAELDKTKAEMKRAKDDLQNAKAVPDNKKPQYTIKEFEDIANTVNTWGGPFRDYRYNPLLVNEASVYPSENSKMEGEKVAGKTKGKTPENDDID